MASVAPAFGFLFLLPPPAPGALRLAAAYGAGTGRATDREKASIVQRVIGNAMIMDKSDNAAAGPVEQRVHLDYPMSGIEAGVGRLCTLGGLVGAQSADPGRGASECATERLHLAQCAAGEPSFY